jgi:hypothetical protein
VHGHWRFIQTESTMKKPTKQPRWNYGQSRVIYTDANASSQPSFPKAASRNTSLVRQDPKCQWQKDLSKSATSVRLVRHVREHCHRPNRQDDDSFDRSRYLRPNCSGGDEIPVMDTDDVRHEHACLILELHHAVLLCQQRNQEIIDVPELSNSTTRDARDTIDQKADSVSQSWQLLRQFYRSRSNSQSLTQEDRTETLEFLLDCMDRYRDSSYPSNTSTPEVCLFVLEQLTRATLSAYDERSVYLSGDLVDTIFLAAHTRARRNLLILVRWYHSATSDLRPRIRYLLQHVSSFHWQNSVEIVEFTKLSIASLEVDTTTNNQLHAVNLPFKLREQHEGTSNYDQQLFYWRCLSCSSNGIALLWKKRETSQVLRLLEDTAVSKNPEFAVMAAATLSALASLGPDVTTSPDFIADALIRILIDADWDAKLESVSGLRLCFRDKRVECVILTEKHCSKLERIIANLTKIVLLVPEQKQRPNHQIQRDAATILLDMMAWLTTRPHQICEGIPCSDLVKVCQALLGDDSREIVKQTVSMIAFILGDDPKKILTDSPTILTSLATTSIRWSTVSDLTISIMDIFQDLSSADGEIQSLLVRQPRVLESLVILTNSQTNTGGRQAAISLVLAISSNPCHRRCLAKQVGLLSGLIRYVRWLDESSLIQAESSHEREGLKECIRLIANVL